MTFLELVQKRYSVRAYEDRAVEDEKLAYILEAARMAPTGSNRQAFQLIVVHTKGREAEVKRLYGQAWFTDAPVVICVCADPNYGLNVGIVQDHMILAATEQGLGTCWIGAFDRDAAREILGVPAEFAPIIMMTLGYGADEPRTKKRKDLDDLVRYERW
ncbi:MAG: nitroreductase family protein [Anaerolineae bacterium]|nr:nitroreductase family protein [Anaerolineae bacterium]